jgi:monoamine oxidase
VDAVVLHARDRVGGRLEGGMMQGHPVELGGAWIGEGHTQMYRIVAQGTARSGTLARSVDTERPWSYPRVHDGLDVRLATPVDTITRDGPGVMEGAVRSGIATAREVVGSRTTSVPGDAHE